MIEAMSRLRASPALLAGMLVLAAGALSYADLAVRLPSGDWLRALFWPNPADLGELTAHYSWLPRLVTALLCGAGLGLAGAVFQQVLRNPLASPATLGVSAGANLALALAALWAPALLAGGREWVALAGAASAMAIVFALAWRKALSPLAVVLGGLIISLYCGALSAVLIVFNQQYLVGLLLWGAGSLSQQDWSAVTFLAPRIALAAGLIALMARPLTLAALDDESARSLGLPLTLTRASALALAVALSAFVVSAVGIIGFVGLAAPALAMLAGARRFQDRLVWSPIIGAALLWFTDAIAQNMAGLYADLLPTGALTALFGSPLLLWLLPRLKSTSGVPQSLAIQPRARMPGFLIAMLAAALVLAVALALTAGRGPDGWSFDGFTELAPWRWPRTLAALAAGAMLAMAGMMLQRVTNNPMASPEVLGVSAGAALGFLIAVFAFPGAGRPVEIGFGGLGALAVIAGVLALGRRSHFSPERILLAGIAFGAFFDALVVALTATGDPRAGLVLAWLTGSTYRVTELDAIIVAATAAGLFIASFFTLRWLDLLPLGDETARAVGVNTSRGRLVILIIAALLSSTATLIVGPLSFAGLIAPHLARSFGLQRALWQLIGAALIGALIMVAADWLGRVMLFPRQVPAGLIACLIGAPYFMWRLRAG